MHTKKKERKKEKTNNQTKTPNPLVSLVSAECPSISRKSDLHVEQRNKKWHMLTVKLRWRMYRYWFLLAWHLLLRFFFCLHYPTAVIRFFFFFWTNGFPFFLKKKMKIFTSCAKHLNQKVCETTRRNIHFWERSSLTTSVFDIVWLSVHVCNNVDEILSEIRKPSMYMIVD